MQKFITKRREENANVFANFRRFDAVTTQQNNCWGYNTITDVKRLNPSNRLATSVYFCRLNFAVSFHVSDRGCAQRR